MNRLKILLLIAVLALFSSRVNAGDTGTYKILDYTVVLTPRSDGTVDIDYYQKWKVESGHIPWITVGLPNSDFKIVKSGMAVKKIGSANEGGIRIDLDKDYQPNDVFEISFSVVQDRLFYADEKDYKLDFTPGWYDRAFIDRLVVSVKFFAKIATVNANPKPTSITDDTMVWTRQALGKGERFEISLSFPNKLFPKEISKDKMKEEVSAGTVLVVVVIIVIIVVILVALEVGSGGDGSGYSGGSIFWSGGSSGSGSSGRSSGGGGGFGGRSAACVCACVACACASACAGGGGAGCANKAKHTCPQCADKKKEVKAG